MGAATAPAPAPGYRSARARTPPTWPILRHWVIAERSESSSEPGAPPPQFDAAMTSVEHLRTQTLVLRVLNVLIAYLRFAGVGPRIAEYSA